MQYTYLLCSWNGDDDLDKFAREIFSFFGILEFQERQSDNYEEGRYFRGTIENVRIEIDHNQLVGFEAYHFGIVIRCEDTNHERFIFDLENAIVKQLLPKGFRIAKLDPSKPNGERIFEYQSEL